MRIKNSFPSKKLKLFKNNWNCILPLVGYKKLAGEGPLQECSHNF